MKDQHFYENLFDITQEFIGYYSQHRVPYYHDLVTGFDIKTLGLVDISTMNYLYKNQSAQISKLAKVMVFKLPNMNRLLNKLEELNIIERLFKESSHNVRYVRLTDWARDKYDEIVSAFLARYKMRLEEAISAQELEEAYNALSSLLDTFEKIKVLSERKSKSCTMPLHEAFWEDISCYRFYNNYFFADPPYKKPSLIQKANLSHMHLYSLVFLVKIGESVSMTSFAKQRKIFPDQTTRLFDKLEKAGFVRRFRKEGEHRTVYVEPTESGIEAITLANDMYHDWLSQSFNAVLTDAELDQMIDNYKLLIGVFKKLD